jgi:hypothetical protein
MKIDLLTSFSVTKEELPDESKAKIEDILLDGEQIVLAYSHVRDKVWFTSKRIIALDVQGITGSKKEYKSFPYSKISSFAIETAGTFDGDCYFKIWVSGVGVFGIKFRKNINIKKVGKFLSEKVLD